MAVSNRRPRFTRRLTVAVGPDDGVSIEVLDGIDPDELVVLRPSAGIDDGTPVLAGAGRPEKAAHH